MRVAAPASLSASTLTYLLYVLAFAVLFRAAVRVCLCVRVCVFLGSRRLAVLSLGRLLVGRGAPSLLRARVCNFYLSRLCVRVSGRCVR